MSLKKIYETAPVAAGIDHMTGLKSVRVVKVHKDSETGEFRCRLYVDGKGQEPADAFESDKESAIGTADAMVLTDKQRAAKREREEPSVVEEAAESAPRRPRPRGYYEQPSKLLGGLLGRALGTK